MEPDGCPTPSSENSPVNKRHDKPMELTPRSKVKAIIAAIENESDSDESLSPESGPARLSAQLLSANTQISGSESHGSSEETRKVPAPRGKLAAHLHKKDRPPTQELETNNNDDDAYTRMKKKLAGPSLTSTNDENPASPVQETPDSDTDEAINVVRKRRQGISPVSAKSKSPSPIAKSPRQRSPGLFMTPEKERAPKSPPLRMSETVVVQRDGSDSDLPSESQAKNRLLELVARKREQRLAKEAEAAERARARELALGIARKQKRGSRDHQLSEDESDGSAVEKLTQNYRPTRKASKKAEEENKRQIQRMSRNMQLAHQARTKKKITKESFFARFNFRTKLSPAAASQAANSSSAAASSDRASDDDALPHAESPPTSPLTGPQTPENGTPKPDPLQPQNMRSQDFNVSKLQVTMDDELPDIQDVIANSQERLDRGKGRAASCAGISDHVPVVEATNAREKTISKDPLRIRLQRPVRKSGLAEDSESDLEILPIKGKMRKVDKVFARLPTSRSNEGRSLHALRTLAHVMSPNKQTSGTKPSMSLSEMQNSLQKRARQQAACERAEKIQELKDRGIIIQTAEERQQDQAEVEDLLEKARREAVDLKQKEKDKAKREARANGEAVADDTSEDDEDYHDNDADVSDVELSGSEDEGDDELDGEGDSAEEGNDAPEEDVDIQPGELIMHEASEDSGENDEDETPGEDCEALSAEEEDILRLPARNRHKKVIDDDDEEDLQEEQGVDLPPTEEIAQPNILGLPTFGVAPMGMTQAFAATMADSQTQEDGLPEIADQEEDSLAFLGPPPEPETMELDTQDSPLMITDSQGNNANNAESQAHISLHLSQYQVTKDGLEDPTHGLSATQSSDIPDPTQDVGFALSSPVSHRFASIPPSTVDTVILPRDDEPGSPIVKKKGRLRRKTDVVLANHSDLEADAEQVQGGRITPENAFDALKKGLKKSSKTVQDFDKKKSNAKEMVEEQAQESEDEYAGLGGASDDESHGEEDEEVRKMIEQGDVDVDERQLAAFYADKERASDEKAVEKLFKDINNGMLRRKRGAEFDLSDSDDDVEARRRRKRKEFAKMRKALLENENVGKIAEDPRKVAFLRAIEDREDDEDLDFLEQPEESSRSAMDVDSQNKIDSQAANETESPTTATLGKRKRPLTDSNPETTNRLPPASRRTTTMKKPLSLAEIRASVSFLIEAPDAMNIAPPSSSPVASDNENDENGEEHAAMQPPPNKPIVENADNTNTNSSNNNPFASRRRPNPVIDRLSLKRGASSSTSASTSSHLAFQNLAASTSATFRVPSLLRRATTSSFNPNNSTDSNGISTLAETERSAGGTEKGDFVRRGGTKRSSVNFKARRAVERAVEEGVRRKVRREGSSLAGLGGGNFE
ncbi:MAG: hypothetical protein Q9169_006125 [Polycauliona sp. 2 TL-2023]